MSEHLLFLLSPHPVYSSHSCHPHPAYSSHSFLTPPCPLITLLSPHPHTLFSPLLTHQPLIPPTPPSSLRIVLSTIQFGAAGTVASTVAFGPEVSVPFFFGSLAGAFYLYLLGKKTDSIGAGKKDHYQMLIGR